MAESGGLLDFIRTPEGQGLLSATFGGLAGARSGTPWNNLGRAGMAGVMGYGNAQDRQAQQGEAEQMKKYRQAQMDNYQSEIDKRNLATESEKRKQAALPGLFTGGSPALAPLMAMPDAGILASPGRASTPSSLNVQAALQAGYTPDEISKLDGLRNIGLNKVERTVKGMVNGREVEQQMDNFGRPVGQGMEQYKAPIEVSTGANKMLLDPFTRQPLSTFKMEQSPDSRASNALGWANNGLSRERLTFDQTGGGDGGASQSGMNKKFGKAQAGYRWKDDGSLEFIPGGPADQKAQAQKGGEGTVGGVVADLRDKYTKLDADNGIVSTNNRIGTNIGASFGASGVGQFLNGAVGTKTQSSRDSIAMTRPLLLQAIMKATGMSAKQMDSNAELKLYLATATDPQKGLEANLEALDRIESLYGGGSEKFKPNTPQASTKNGWSMQKVN
jgi:hypothetical protein